MVEQKKSKAAKRRARKKQSLNTEPFQPSMSDSFQGSVPRPFQNAFPRPSTYTPLDSITLSLNLAQAFRDLEMEE